MRKLLLWLGLFFVPVPSHAVVYKYIQLSSATSPSIQPGTSSYWFFTASGTSTGFNTSTFTVRNSTSTGDMVFNRSTQTFSGSFARGTLTDLSTRTFQGGWFSGTRIDNSTTTLQGAIWGGTGIDNSTTSYTGQLLAANGAVGSPPYSFFFDTDCGLYRIGADNIGFGTGGANAWNVDASQNMGIGTTSQGDRLEVSKSASTEGQGLIVTNSLSGGFGSGLRLQSKTAFGGNNLAMAGQIQTLGADAWTSSTTMTSALQIKALYKSTMTTVIDGRGSGVAILGTNTNDSASAGNYGEYSSSQTVINSTAGTTAQYFTVGHKLTLTLTPGDWDITGVCKFIRNSATWTASTLECGIGTADGNSATGLVDNENNASQGLSDTTWTAIYLSMPNVRKSISATTTFYLKGFSGTYTGGPPQCTGRISARRVR